MREMVNVGENRARNGVTDCPESRNEDKIENIWISPTRAVRPIPKSHEGRCAWLGWRLQMRNLSSETINNINYLMTIKAMSLTLNVQKDSIRYHCEVRKYRPRSSRKCDMKVPAAVGQNMSTAVKGAAYAYGGLNDLNHVMYE
ncbi:hypothetical protein E3N88_15102 [Mikania micrantha]|uniref:Uncharacterized protein n=1 Tax=Mikania micrantha TaxID=192012 RepID=A0A5N6NV35_9ASTR|nr:hypothetical protein E3N88_15102 [Mikania micrantha]